MPQTIYGLAWETVYQDGTALILSRTPQLRREDMAPLDEKMLKRVRVPGLLPIEFQEIDSNITLRYAIPSAYTLLHALSAAKHDVRAVASLLYALASVLEDSKVYMLSEERYVLHESFIYVSAGRTDDVRMLYVPLKHLKGKLPFQRELAQLAARAFDIAQIPRASVEELIAYANDSAFQLAEWKSMLLAYMDGAENEPGMFYTPPTQTHLERLPEPPPAADNRERGANRVGRGSKVAVAIAFLLLAVNWAVVCYYASEGTLTVGIGVTMLAADGLYYLLKVKRGEQAASMTDEPQPLPSAQSPFIPANAAVRQQVSRHPAYPSKPVSHSSESPPMAPTPSVHKPVGNVYSALAQQTVLLRPREETVLLVNGGYGQAGCARLEISSAGRTDEIILQRERFVIGRHMETSDYAIDIVGVSRMHAEICRNGSNYSVKDLGSKNGTSLNGDKLIPFQEYELHDGDCISVIQTDFIFRNG